MNISIQGCSSKRLKLFIEEAIHIVLSDYLSPRRLANLDLKIVFQRKLLKNEGIVADCDWDPSLPQNFKIRIKSSMKQHKVMLCLFHELMHVKQYALEELRDSARRHHVHKWAGDWSNFKEHDYYDLPWEVDAHGREKGSYLKWIRSSTVLTTKEKVRFFKNKPF